MTGPLVLSASSQIPKKFRGQELTLSIDLKPALTPEQLDDLMEKIGASDRIIKFEISAG